MKAISWVKNKINKHGWKAVLGIFTYYLIRDLTLYVLLPYLIIAK